MKKILITTLLIASMTASQAMTFWNNGVLMGTVCRNGVYYTNYPAYNAQPVGSICPVRDGYGNVIGSGVVTDE